jgi:hypothetical protein
MGQHTHIWRLRLRKKSHAFEILYQQSSVEDGHFEPI